MKRKLDEEPQWTARRAYNNVVNQLTVDEASFVAPVTSVERALQWHKVRNRPALPTTRQDLVLEHEHTVTTDGRQFLLIDNGLADRILVFGSEKHMERFE